MNKNTNHKKNRVPIWILKQFDKLASVAVLVSDYTIGTILYANPSLLNITGYPMKYFLEQGMGGLYSIMHPEDMAAGQSEVAAYLNNMTKPGFNLNQIHFYTFEFRIKHPDGHWIWIHTDAYPVQIKDNGHPHLFISILRDISSQKAAEHLLWNELFAREPDPDKQKKIIESHQALANPAYGMPLPHHLLEMTMRTDPQNHLSTREMEVLKLIAEGKSSKEISELLQISFHTTETHRKNILKKFKVKNVAELIREAGRSYWLGS